MSEYTVQRFRTGYAVVWKDPITRQRRRYQLDATDRASAEAEARKRWRGTADHNTVGALVEAYLRDKQAEGIASITRRKDAWKAMKPFWENVDPALIDEQMCKDYRATRKVSDTTARYELLMLSTALDRAVSLPRKPRLWFPPLPERKTRHLTPPEFRKFKSEIRSPHALLYVMLGVYTLARPSAILELQWSQVDFGRGLINLNQPGRLQTVKRRPVVPIGGELLEILKEAYANRDGSPYVITRGGKQIGTIKKAFENASKRSGVHATPYTLRHTGAVWMAESGVPIPEIAQFMGHDDSRTTEKHYSRYSPGYLLKAANAITDALNGKEDL